MCHSWAIFKMSIFYAKTIKLCTHMQYTILLIEHFGWVGIEVQEKYSKPKSHAAPEGHCFFSDSLHNFTTFLKICIQESCA